MKLTVTPKLFLPLLLLTLISGGFLAFMTTKILDSVARDTFSAALIAQTQRETARGIAASAFTSPADDSETLGILRVFLAEAKGQDVLRVKLWSRDGVIFFSDAEDIIGQSFPDNPEFLRAMQGTPVVSFKRGKAEQGGEEIFGSFAEVYIPIAASGSSDPVGVVEMYYNSTFFERNMRRQAILVIALSFGVPLLLLFSTALFFRLLIIEPLQKLQRDVKDMIKHL